MIRGRRFPCSKCSWNWSGGDNFCSRIVRLYVVKNLVDRNTETIFERHISIFLFGKNVQEPFAMSHSVLEHFCSRREVISSPYLVKFRVTRLGRWNTCTNCSRFACMGRRSPHDGDETSFMTEGQNQFLPSVSKLVSRQRYETKRPHGGMNETPKVQN